MMHRLCSKTLLILLCHTGWKPTEQTILLGLYKELSFTRDHSEDYVELARRHNETNAQYNHNNNQVRQQVAMLILFIKTVVTSRNLKLQYILIR